MIHIYDTPDSLGAYFRFSSLHGCRPASGEGTDLVTDRKTSSTAEVKHGEILKLFSLPVVDISPLMFRLDLSGARSYSAGETPKHSSVPVCLKFMSFRASIINNTIILDIVRMAKK